MNAYVAIVYVVIVMVIVYVSGRVIVRGTPVQGLVACVLGLAVIGALTGLLAAQS